MVRKDNDTFLWPLPWLSLLPTADNTLPKGASDQRTKNIGDWRCLRLGRLFSFLINLSRMMLMHFVPQVSLYSAQVANLFEPLLLRDPRPRPRILCFVLTSPGGLFSHYLCFVTFLHLELFLTLSQPPEEGRTCWRNLGKVRSEFVVEEISKWELLVSDFTGFSYILQGDFFNCPPPEFAKCWLVSNWFQKNVRVPDWPPPLIGKRLSVWRSEYDSNT